MKLFDSLSISTEDNETSQIKETEAIIYAKVLNKEGLSEAIRKEKHIQYESTFKNGQRNRVRKVTDEDSVDKYFFTVKINRGESDAFEINNEYTLEADENFLEGYKQVAEKLIEKTRYIFSSEKVELSFKINGVEKNSIIPNIEYEVDIFTKNGVESEWCKIDIELDNIINYISKEHPDIETLELNIKVSHLAFKPSETILMFNASDADKEKVSNLWNNEFSTSL